MKNILILFLSLVLADVAFSQIGPLPGRPIKKEGKYREVYYRDVNVLALIETAKSGRLVAVTLTSTSPKAFDKEAIRELNLDGVKVNVIEYAEFRGLKSMLLISEKNKYVELQEKNVSDELGLIGGISDEAWDSFESSAMCGFSLIACGISAASVIDTFGATWIMAKMSCTTAGISCISAVRKYSKWKKLQQKKIGEDRAEAGLPPGGGGDGTGSGSGSPGGGGDGGQCGGCPGEPILDLSCWACEIHQQVPHT
jgi:hypothetical protein